MALPVALQLYSVRDELEADFEGTIAKVKEFGYDGVEFAGLYGKSAEQVKKILADAGLTPVSAHVPLDELLSDTQAVVATYKEIGCKYIAVPYLPEDRRPGTEGFDRTIEVYTSAIRTLFHADFTAEGINQLVSEKAVFAVVCNQAPAFRFFHAEKLCFGAELDVVGLFRIAPG